MSAGASHMSATIEDLVAKHKAALTEYERAQIECELWDNHAGADVRAIMDRERWLKKLTGENGNKTGLRQTLLNAGPDIDEIWTRIIRDGMPLPTAWGRLKAAGAYATENKIPLTEGVKIALSEYDGWPAARTKSGQMYRKRPPYSVADRPVRRVKRTHINPDAERKFWIELKQKISVFIGDRLGDVDHLTANRLQRDFGIRLQTICDEFSSKINAARIRARKDNAVDSAAVKFARVRAACVALAVDPPGRNGLPVDLSAANRNKKKLVVQYHPDANQDGNYTDEKAAKYNEVIEAYTTLELYNDQLPKEQAIG